MADIGHPLAEIGIPCYPQGHAFIPDAPLAEALAAKAEFASYMTTQLCFDPAAIGAWIAARRAEGLLLPVHIGLPGVAEPHKLLAITARIGVADTHRFLTKNARFVARLIRSGGFYRPDGLLEGLATGHRGPGRARRRPAPLHVQQRRRHRDVAAQVPRLGVGQQRFLTSPWCGPLRSASVGGGNVCTEGTRPRSTGWPCWRSASLECVFGETGHPSEVSSMPISFRFQRTIARIAAMVGALFGVESPATATHPAGPPPLTPSPTPPVGRGCPTRGRSLA